ncbi:MAG: hypothetical protein J0H01_35225 [Rhizobiales bacterium]|nr:hypothetical protein [Hyphomicrobiales bacterium]
MEHRHLDRPGYSLAAIDDIIVNGSFVDWLEMLDAAANDDKQLRRIEHIADHGISHGEDPDRYVLWKLITRRFRTALRQKTAS